MFPKTAERRTAIARQQDCPQLSHQNPKNLGARRRLYIAAEPRAAFGVTGN
jgi:hypothetical protein